MSTIKFTPSFLRGELNIITSKSYAHRALIVASLANGMSTIYNMPISQDVEATKAALMHFGVLIDGENIDARELRYDQSPIDCFASGSTLRMLIPMAMAKFEHVIFQGTERLFQRPLDVYEMLFKDQIKRLNHTQLEVKGPIHEHHFKVDGSKSSQFISGLLMMSPLLNRDVTIEIEHTLTSKSYVDMTLDIMKHFGVHVHVDQRTYTISKTASYQPSSIEIEGDYSQAAFFLVAGIIGHPIHVKGLKKDSKQGDAKVLDIITNMGGSLTWTHEGVIANPSQTHGITIDLEDIPDLGPILMVLAALSTGTSVFKNVDRLTFKESDRLHTMMHVLDQLGVMHIYENNTLAIEGVESFHGNVTLSSEDDHRIAMTIAIASIRAKNPIILTQAEAIQKSYPQFYDVFQSLGGKIDEY